MTSWPKCLRSVALAATLWLSLIATGWGQHGHSHMHLHDEAIVSPGAEIQILLDVDLDSGTVHGRYNLSYDNRYDAPIYELCFRLDSSQHITFDSILYLAAPVATEDIERSDSLLCVNLYPPIDPGEEGLLILTYDAILEIPQPDEPVLDLAGTWPMLCPQADGRPFTRMAWGEVANYDVAVTLDSAYLLAHSGRLLNERLVYGVLPEPEEGKILFDLRNLQLEAPDIRGVLPVNPRGRREYVMRDYLSTGPTLLAAGSVELSRQQLRGTRVTYYRLPVVNERAMRLLPATVELLWRAYGEYLDLVPSEYLKVIVGVPPAEPQPGNDAVVLPSDMLDTEILPAAVAVAMANRLLLPVLLDRPDVAACFNLGLVYYLAAMVLYDVYGADGYDMLTKYEEAVYRKRLKPHGSFLGCETGMIDRMYRTAAAHYALANVIGADSAWATWSSFIDATRAGYPTEDDMIGLVAELHPEPLRTRLKIPSEYRIERVSSVARGGSHETQVMVMAVDQRTAWPVEVAFVTERYDTLYDTVFVPSEASMADTAVSICKTSERVVNVILDPHHYLPLNNREQNYWFRYPKPFHYRAPDDLFPAYRRLQ